MQDDLTHYCWFGKYFDQHGNKKFVSLSKAITQDPDEADEMMQERIPEPFTKFVFCGTISQADADKEGYQSLRENYQLPAKLYHATYAQFLSSIQTNGLGNTQNKMWTDSKTGVVYLAKDPWEAESYAEESEWLDDKEDVYDYLDNIVILEIDTDKLDVNNLYRDENLLPGGDEVIGFEYHGIIPWEACRVFESTISEEFHEYENLESQPITEKLVALFWEGLSDYSSDVWFDLSSNEKERLLWWALEKLDEPVDRDFAIEIFWQWADSLEADSFIDFDGLTESHATKSLSNDRIKVEEKNGHFEIYKDGKLVCTCDNMQEVKTELAELDESVETDFAAAFKQYASLWD